MWSVLTIYIVIHLCQLPGIITILTVTIFSNIEHLSFWLNTFTTIFILQLLCMLKLFNKYLL